MAHTQKALKQTLYELNEISCSRKSPTQLFEFATHPLWLKSPVVLLKFDTQACNFVTTNLLD